MQLRQYLSLRDRKAFKEEARMQCKKYGYYKRHYC